MEVRRDIVATWPQTRELESYLAELKRAEKQNLVINYRVGRLPKTQPERCYMVHSGSICGWCEVVDMCWRGQGQVQDPVTKAFMFPGYYIVRSPKWHALKTPVEMSGFQGWRWIDRKSLR